MPEIRPRDNQRRSPRSGRDGQENVRTGTGAKAIAQGLLDNLRCLQATLPQHATRNDWYMALAYTVRDRMLERYTATVDAMTGASTAKLCLPFRRIPDRTAWATVS